MSSRVKPGQRHRPVVRAFYEYQNSVIDDLVRIVRFSKKYDKRHEEYIRAADSRRSSIEGEPSATAEPADGQPTESVAQADVEAASKEPESWMESMRRRPELVVVYLSFAVNVFLLACKLAAAIQSLSLAVIASALDSLLDVLSGALLFVVALFQQRAEDDPHSCLS